MWFRQRFPHQKPAPSTTKIRWDGTKSANTPLFPYQKSELLTFLKKANFVNLQFYGDMNLTLYEKDYSPNLVIMGKKN